MTISLFVFNSCGDDTETTDDLNFVSFESTSYDFGVALDGTTSQEVLVYSTQIKGSDRNINITVDTEKSTADPASYTIPAFVTIPAKSNVGALPITISDINIGDAGKKIVLKLSQESNLFVGKDITINVTQVCPFNEVVLNILFDGYGSETTWDLKNSSNVVIASGGPYTDGLVSASAKFCLANGTYSFTVNDAYGDGLSYPANGKVTLINNGNVLAEVIGDFGASATKTFTVGN